MSSLSPPRTQVFPCRPRVILRARLNLSHKTWGGTLALRKTHQKPEAGREEEWTKTLEVQSRCDRLVHPKTAGDYGYVDTFAGAKIQPGWTSSPSPPRPPRVLPSPGQTPRSSDSFPLAEMPSLPSAGGKGEEGEDARGGGVHRGPPPQRASGMREGTRAVGEPPHGMEGSSPEREPGGLDGRGWGEVWAPRLITSNLEPQTSNPRHAAGPVLVYFHFFTFWSTNSGADLQHTPRPSQPHIWDEINGPSPFVGTRPFPPHPQPFPTNPDPPLYFGETTSHPPPIPHLGLDSRPLPLD